MKLVLQRVTRASVTIDGKVAGSIEKGYVLLLGVGKDDTEAQADALAAKVKKLRLFADAEGKTNLSIDQVGGGVLVVSQFTLYADCKKGTRPSFVEAGAPEHANRLYNYFVARCRQLFSQVQTGEFGADMQVSLINDGPFTLVLEAEPA